MLKVLNKIKQKKIQRKAQLELAAKQHKYLIDCKTDVAFLQKMIALVNKDPELIVDIILPDNTKVQVYRRQWDKARTSAYFFNGEEY